jgi:hypothetical protein
MNAKALIEQQRLRRQRLRQNLGLADRQIRAVIGTLLLTIPILAITGPLGLWSVVMLASIPVLNTAITGWDPIYAIIGKNTYQARLEDIQQRHWTHANIGIIERGIRLGVGLVMLTALMGAPSMTGGMALTLLAIPLIMTAITAWDPFYAAMSVNSFTSRIDVEAAEPGIDESKLAEYYEFPQTQVNSDRYANAA